METKRRKTLITPWKSLLFYLQLPTDTGSCNNCLINCCSLKSRSLCLRKREDSQEKFTDFHTGIYNFFPRQINMRDCNGLEFLATTSFRSRCFYFFQFPLTILASTSSFTYHCCFPLIQWVPSKLSKDTFHFTLCGILGC